MRPLSLLSIVLSLLLLASWACSPSPTPLPCTTNADCPNATCDLALGICLSNPPTSNSQQADFPKDKIYYCAEPTQCPLQLGCKDGVCSPQCSEEDDCAQNQQSCLRARFCGRCTKHTDCFSGLSCQEGRCVPCTQDAQCAANEYCDTTTQLCKRRCSSREDCETGLLCTQARCAPCENDSDCNTGEICQSLGNTNGEATTKLCRIGCRSNQACTTPTPQCDTARFVCVACLQDKDCGNNGLFCKQQACVTCEQAGCEDGEFCVQAKQRCIPNGCNQNSDCKGRNNGNFCDPTTSTCVMCFEAAHCIDASKGVICKQNTCHPCEKDADCPAQQICHNRTCKDQACRSYLDCLIAPNATLPNPNNLRYCAKAEGQDIGTCKACASSQSCATEICGNATNCKSCTNTKECQSKLGANTHCVAGLGVCAQGQCSTWQECFDATPPNDPLGKLCVEAACKTCTDTFGTLKSVGLDPNQLKAAYEGQTTSAPFVWEPSLTLPADTRNLFYQWDVGDAPPGLQHTFPSQNTPTFSMHGTFANTKTPGQPQHGQMTITLSLWQYAPSGKRIVCRLDLTIPWTIWPKLESDIANKPNAHPSQPLIVWRPYERNQPEEIDASTYVKGGGVIAPNESRPRFRCSLYQGVGQGVVPPIFENASGCKLKRKILTSRPNGYYGFLVSVEDTLGQKVEIPFLVIPDDCSESNRTISGPDPIKWLPLHPTQTATWTARIEDAAYQILGGSKLCGLTFRTTLTSPLLSPSQDAPSSALSCTTTPAQPLCVRCTKGCSLCNENLCRSRSAPGVCAFPVGVTFSYEVELRRTPPLRPGKPAFLAFQIRNAYNYATQFHCQISLFESPLLTAPSP